MKVFITGANGQLGQEICKELKKRNIDYRGPSSEELDITDADKVRQFIREYLPDAVIHCAAYTKVDQAEEEKELCFAVNEGGTRNVATACKEINAKLMYLSTDYIFSGQGRCLYDVTDSVAPQNVYGASKLAGERVVCSMLSRYFIVRTSWMFGADSSNFVERILYNAEVDRPLAVVTDQIGSPTYAVDLAVLLCDMIQTERFGIYHATNEGFCSRFEFAQEVLRQAWVDKPLKETTSSEYVLPAARPVNSCLSKDSLDQAGFSRLPDWHDALWRYLRSKNGPKKVLVTGGNGYIGKHVVKYLLDIGIPVMVAVRGAQQVDPRAKTCPEPIFSGAEDIYRRVGSPDVCIHLAWQDGFVHNSPAHMRNLSKHIEFCNHMMEGGLPILSCMGTMHEVGYWEGAIDEDTPCNPQTQYGIAKNAMRQSLLLSSKQTECTMHWLRLYYIVSDDIQGNNIFAKILQAVQAGKTHFPFNTGKNLFDFIEIDELAKLIVEVSLQREISGVTNICTGQPESLASCVERFIKVHNLPIQLEYGKYPDRPYDSPGEWGDATKLQKILSNEQ